MAEAAQTPDNSKEANLANYSAELQARKRDYETVFIISPAVDNKRVEELVEKAKKTISDATGEVTRLDDWGKVRMAYEINKHQTGHYYYIRYFGSTNTVKAFERIMKLEPDFLRFQTVRLSDNLKDSELDDLRQRIPGLKIYPPHQEPEDEEFHGFQR